MNKKKIGWTIALCGSYGFEIEKVDECRSKYAPEDDDEATERAIAVGVPIIPVEELPNGFSRDYLGWVDTPHNRKLLERSVRGDRPKKTDPVFDAALAEVDAIGQRLKLYAYV